MARIFLSRLAEPFYRLRQVAPHQVAYAASQTENEPPSVKGAKAQGAICMVGRRYIVPGESPNNGTLDRKSVV